MVLAQDYSEKYRRRDLVGLLPTDGETASDPYDRVPFARIVVPANDSGRLKGACPRRVRCAGREWNRPLEAFDRFSRGVGSVASHAGSAPADGTTSVTAGGCAHADTIYAVHAGAACFADFDDHVVRLLQGSGWQSLRR